jgi:hypothetical protein
VVVPNIITNISIALTPFPLKSTRQSAASMFFLFLALLLVAVEAKVKVWSFSAGHAKLRSGAVFQELVATLGSCDFPNVPRSCEYLGQQRIENSAVPGAYNFVVAGCAAAVDFGSIYGCNPKLKPGTPAPRPTISARVSFMPGICTMGPIKALPLTLAPSLQLPLPLVKSWQRAVDRQGWAGIVRRSIDSYIVPNYILLLLYNS